MGPDKRFYITRNPVPVSEALDIVQARDHESDALLTTVSEINKCDAGALIYAENEAAAAQLDTKKFALCFANQEICSSYQGPQLVVACENPRAAFAHIADRLHKARPISPAGIDEKARLEKGVIVHPTAVVSAHAVIGAKTTIAPHSVIGPGVEIGAGSSIETGCVITCALIGEGFVAKAGARLGQSGFGFVETSTGILPMPQLGRLIIGDQVEVGANTTLDRGALGDTKIGTGTKIDNLVQIGHNVQIGRNCLIAAQVGIAGSTIVEDGVLIGGQAGLADHLHIGAMSKIAAKAGVMGNIPPGETWGGYPARPSRRWLKETAMLARSVKKKS